MRRGTGLGLYGLWMHLRGLSPRRMHKSRLGHPQFEITNRPQRLLWIGLAFVFSGLVWSALIFGGLI